MFLKGNEKVAEYEDDKICIKSKDILQEENATKRPSEFVFMIFVISRTPLVAFHASFPSKSFYFSTVTSSSWWC
jgi:hypothetical protein